LEQQVFRDDTRRRWRRLQIATATSAIALIALGVLFSRTLRPRPTPTDAGAGATATLDLAELRARATARARASTPVGEPGEAAVGSASFVSRAGLDEAARGRRLAFVDATEQEGIHALDVHAAAFTHAAVEGMHLRDALGGVLGRLPDDVLEIARRRGLPAYEVIDVEREGVAHPEEVSALGRDRLRARRFAAEIEARLRDDGAAGVILALDRDEADPDGALRAIVVDEVAARLRPAKLQVGVRVDGGVPSSGFDAEARAADFVVLRAYRGVDPTGAPGPLSPRAWVASVVDDALSVVPRDKLIVALATRAGGWPVRAADLASAGRARELQWGEVIARARVAGELPSWDPPSGNLIVALPGPTGIASSARVRAHPLDDGTVGMVAWMSDAATFADARLLLARRGVASFATGALGGDDPRLFRVIAAAPDDRAALRAALAEIPHAREPDVIGDGVAMRVDFGERDGRASIDFAIGGRVELERYDQLPSSPTVVRRAQVPSRAVALTFDDGPSRAFTPGVLDALREEGVHATFFVVGGQIERAPELLGRLVAEGHELGNHSFSHPDLGTISRGDADLQINATNRLIESLTGRSTILFRPPFRSDDRPTVAEDLIAIRHGERNGMITITSNVDPHDWARPAPAVMVDYLVRRLEKADGGVVLMHDGGGDRANTVATVRPLIRTLRARGFRFVTVHELLGAPADGGREWVNPKVRDPATTRLVSKTVWYGGALLLSVLKGLAVFGLALGLFRFAALGIGAALDMANEIRDRRAIRRTSRLPKHAAVSVVIPAYNEAKVIERTILSVLASRGVAVEVLVLDDGSTDNTADVVSRAFYFEPRVRLVRLENGGKARALNVGFELASHPVVVALDADTIFLPDTIVELARKFDDPRVAAVAGRAAVGNVNHFIGRWQALEYVIGQAIERRAWHLLGVVSVVPGAVGAWHRDRVREVGGFGTDTLAEDCDLTITLQVHGHRVSYAPAAVALTEAPESVRALLKQRFRWCFGVLQTVWKHSGAMLRPTRGRRAIGLLLMPAILLSHLGTPLLAPLADVAALVALALGNARAVLPYAIGLFMAELILTLLAVRLDRARFSLMRDWLVNRSVYRWLLFVALARAVLAALRGGAVGWGKLVRTGTVRAPVDVGQRVSRERKVTA
jgi:cellulose synthase/poly-beta-1,6-N-acetylglucosamine synthase-like glycosyltransferase/peptidoglycan/xylan/chitin deacetylase (PgdA/CDA1 family)